MQVAGGTWGETGANLGHVDAGEGTEPGILPEQVTMNWRRRILGRYLGTLCLARSD